MNKNDKTKLSLIYCSEKRCDECFYNRWVRDVCQTHLCRDALKLISNLERPERAELEQLKINI